MSQCAWWCRSYENGRCSCGSATSCHCRVCDKLIQCPGDRPHLCVVHTKRSVIEALRGALDRLIEHHESVTNGPCPEVQHILEALTPPAAEETP